MNTNKYPVVVTAHEYNILEKNLIISACCKKQLQTATKHGEEIELSLTLGDLEDLTGYVAAESNHARTKRQRQELDAICDYLESLTSSIKRTS